MAAPIPEALGFGPFLRDLISLGDWDVRWTVGDGDEVTLRALVHEFGSSDGRVPERSYLRSALRENVDRLLAALLRAHRDVLTKRRSVRAAYRSIGKLGVQVIKRKIRTAGEWAKPLAESTVRRKLVEHPTRARQPLVATAEMARKVRYLLVQGGRVVEEGAVTA